MIGRALSGMGGYIALVFFAAQFVAFFSYSNLGAMTSAAGAGLLKMTGFTGIPLILSFAVLVAFLNLFVGSASAKWALLAPIFVPMFMQLDYTPEFTQLVYRLGDSSTNIITPMMPYFAMMLVFMQRYDKNAKLGTLISYMLPYSVLFFVCWCILLALWMLLDLPIGIGAVIRM
jgi:aminobenzoyl-glutamate transport protein